jgi:hypothetical protein
MRIISALVYSTQQSIIQNWWQTETKTIYDHQATTTEDSTRNSAQRRWKQTKPQEDGKY